MAPPPPPPPPPPPGNPPPPPPRPVDNVDIDDERHRREEAARRAKRKAAREKPKSDSKLEKDRKRREHAQRVLQAQQKGKGKPPPPSSSDKKKKDSKGRSSKSKDDAAADAGGSSTFQSLFAQRVSGFLVDLRFRNAPPRPPVGPCFVGLGLDGVLHGSWTRYRPANAVENGHAWKLHPETDLGVPLAPSAMDLEGCYVDPTKPTKKTKTAASTAADGDKSTSGAAGHVTDEETNGKGAAAAEDDEDPAGPPPLHPHDESLLQWTGSLGDTAAEELQVRRDRARAAARLRGEGKSPTAPNDASSSALTSPSERNALRRAKAGIDSQSRILDENLQFFMKKTTYLTNDQYRSVHRFTSLAQVQKKAAEDVDRQLSETKKRVADRRSVEKGFDIVNGPGMKTIRHPNPSKRKLTPVWDVPLLPDVHGWGRTYTHVVLDKMPRASTADNSASATPASPVKSHKNKNNKDATTPTHLERAFVADVGRADGQSKRLRCKVLVPSDTSHNDESANTDADDTNRNKEAYEPVQEYDLDVLPLLQEDEPNVNFVLLLDAPSANDTNKNQGGKGGGGGGGVCWYHPVQSRVALSTGRPVVGTTNATSANASGTKRKRITTLPRGYRVSRRVMNDDDVADLERAGAEVDLDLAEKHGMVDGAGSMEEEDDYGGGAGGRRQKEEVEAAA